MNNPHSLPVTERSLPDVDDLDRRSAHELVARMNEEDATVATAVHRALAEIAELVDVIVRRLRTGGQLFYVGAGTSGRLGVLDASECPPTFGVEPNLVRGLIAGGDEALRSAREGAEDDESAAVRDLDDAGAGPGDVVIGISASGSTPYPLAALRHAKQRGAVTAALVCNPDSAMVAVADHRLEVIVGPELIAGSTRLKAGTATKMVLNMLSTASMVRLGRTDGTAMVDLATGSKKLRERAQRIVVERTGLSPDEAAASLRRHGGSVRAVLDARGGLASAATTTEDVFHLVRVEDWRRAYGQEIAPPSLRDEGFVHCSFRSQVRASAERHFADEDALVAVEIDLATLGKSLRVEDTSGHGAFPHVYGPIPAHACRRALLLLRSSGSPTSENGNRRPFGFPAALRGHAGQPQP